MFFFKLLVNLIVPMGITLVSQELFTGETRINLIIGSLIISSVIIWAMTPRMDVLLLNWPTSAFFFIMMIGLPYPLWDIGGAWSGVIISGLCTFCLFAWLMVAKWEHARPNRLTNHLFWWLVVINTAKLFA